MDSLSFIKSYRDNEDLRKSFNQLASNTFGIEFESWYQNGYWTEKYQPYSFIENSKVVANVSVNHVNLVIHSEIKQAIQIGTVMTHPDYRNRGLSRKLMEIVLDDFKQVDLVYLFANQTVLDFYPKFGFHTMKEVQFIMDYGSPTTPCPFTMKKLDGSNQEDLAFIYNLAKNRKTISDIFATTGSEELLMFYCLMVFSQDLYYLEDENALVIFQIEGDCLHLYDVVSPMEFTLHSILRKIATPECRKVVFHYHPDEQELILNKIPFLTNNVLFIKNLSNVLLPEEFKHPFTSQA
ncbi:GNAT family N-acetyltransferase [Neobacillus drentensis]|uniref:GNAT family N-acetyltransferase n=1 Tax=Neobacillus drentensis TaxID=220684 RepID=UPI0028612789|nr:GNAT family N-acetyltransferase [Neobacillus drentensis]MDR7235980.1 putative N-acetyltransferase YhbS [Neobacillus drentensis]